MLYADLIKSHGNSFFFLKFWFTLAFSNLVNCPAPALLLMRQLRTLPPKALWPLANDFISRFRSILDDGVPRQVQGQYISQGKKTDKKLNSIAAHHRTHLI